MDTIEQYFKLLQEVYDYFDFTEDYVIYPFEDRSNYIWFIDELSGVVTYSKDIDSFKSGDCYSDEIYHQRFYNKWVYKGKNYTMIFVDTHTDGNKFFSVFKNNKEIEPIEY